MRNIVIGFLSFTIALAAGIFLGIDRLPALKSASPLGDIAPHPSSPINSEEFSPEQDISPPNAAPLEWFENNDPNFKIKLLELGEGFHGDEIKAKSGESWTGLFRKNNRFFLKTTKIKITAVHDEIVDDSNPQRKTGKTVETAAGLPAVFLLKNATDLSDGEITTLFYSGPDESTDDSSSLRNGTIKEFDFNGSHYQLRVENLVSQDEFLSHGSKLILMRDGQEQVLRYLSNEYGDCSWDLNWVGDIDRDGKLDFYFLFNGSNSADGRLFLSSKANQGELLRYIARFWITGC